MYKRVRLIQQQNECNINGTSVPRDRQIIGAGLRTLSSVDHEPRSVTSFVQATSETRCKISARGAL